MPKQEVLKLWQAIKGDLARARQLLPEAAISAAAAMQFQEFLDHNELGLACSALEDCGIDHSPRSKFWLALRDAAQVVLIEVQRELHAAQYPNPATSTS